LPVRSPWISCRWCNPRAGLVFLTRKAPASLPLCTQTMNRSKIFCSDDSASFVLENEKPRTTEERELAGIDCARPRKTSSPCGKLFAFMHFCHCRCFELGAAHCSTRFLRSTHLLRRDEFALMFSHFATDVSLWRRDRVCRQRHPKPRRLQIKGTVTGSFGARGRPTSSSRIKGRSLAFCPGSHCENDCVAVCSSDGWRRVWRSEGCL
jgi:hypothetical protein